MILTEGQIKAHVRALRKKAKEPVAFALRSDRPWNGASRIVIDDQPHRVAFCRSDLELREMLRVAKAEKEPLIALCAFGTEALEEDVTARLAKKRVHPPEVREVLASLFQVSSVDPRVFATPALAQTLVENAPSEGYPAVPSGVLDLQTAWSAAMGRVVGSADIALSAARLLEETLDAVKAKRIEAMAPELRREFFAWGALNLDRSVGWMAHLVEGGKTADLVPFGLLLDLLFNPELKGGSTVGNARVRLESWFGGHAIDDSAARNWAAAARGIVVPTLQRTDDAVLASAVLNRFDALLVEFKANELAGRSDFSPAGFEQRIREFAQRLSACVEATPSPSAMAAVIGTMERLRTHALAADHRRRIERCEMAARLGAWITAGGKVAAANGFDELVEAYVRQGDFVDWARITVQEGDSDPNVNKAYDALLARVAPAAGEFEAVFASKLAEWAKHGAAQSKAFLPVEDALDKLVAPLASQSPVLMLVMDGMSLPVFRELLGDIFQRGKWLECRPGDVAIPLALMATVPSITEISRRALFRGKLHAETSPTEQSAFSSNDGLYSRSGSTARPVLFLKGDLQVPGEAGVAATVKNAIINKKCRVVAAVLNAIDEHLSGSDQVASRWDLDVVRPLRELLQIAAEAGRTLIVTSDHGHVLEHRTTQRTGMSMGGDRYREDGGPARDGEIVLSGSRVQQAIGRPELTVAWSRDIRYAGKKRGYHGGVNPQEMLIPIAVLRHIGSTLPAGWSNVSPSPYVPEWWRLSAEAQQAALAEVEAKVTAGLDLFTQAEAKKQATDWIEQLLDSEVYAVQSSHGVRGAMDRKLVANFLEALSSRGGTMPREALAERIGQPLLRVNTVVANLARILNVDGFDIVKLDGATGTVELNVALLRKQFGV